MTRDGKLAPPSESVARLYAAYARAGGSRRTSSSLEDDARQRLQQLREGGFDIGIVDTAAANARVDAIYSHARAALYASVDEGVIRNATSNPFRVRTRATSRDDYLAHPTAGERLRDDDANGIAGLYPAQRPHVQFVISDGLNANAINEHLSQLVPELRRALSSDRRHVGAHDIVVQNGRVRAGYEIGGLVGAAIVVHVIGERPGTGLNTASVYVTYGRDEAGLPRWSRGLDHSVTNAVCGIHPKGKSPQAASADVARLVSRISEERRSGVALAKRTDATPPRVWD
jgi:ethanolamine ammonia-lyase small subunit